MRVMVDGPERSLAQPLEALQRANEIRSYRAGLKVELKAGRVTPAELMLPVPPLLDTMRVYDILVSLPHVGRVKANRTLVRARVSPGKTLGGLTDRQRRELLVLLGAFPSVRRGIVKP